MLTFRLAAPGDDARLVALVNAAFRTPVSLPDWQWFTRQNPNGPSRVYLAEDPQGGIAGLFGFYPTRLWLDGRAVSSSAAHHLAVRQEYRNVRTFVELSRYALESERARGVTMAMATANRRSYQPHKALLGWTDFGYMDCLHQAPGRTSPHDCEQVASFGADFDAFYAEVAKGLSFHFQKTAAWMNWRYRDRPGNPYTSYVHDDGARLCGYLVMKRWVEPDGYRKAHIMDMHALTEATLDHLLAAAGSYASDCDEVNLWCVVGYPYRARLEERGFVARESARQPIIVRVFDGSCPAFPTGPASFMYGDGDGY